MAKETIRTLGVGKMLRVWWNTGVPGNWAKVLAIKPYDGCYRDISNCVLVLPAPNTDAGVVEMSYHSSDFHYDSRPV